MQKLNEPQLFELTSNGLNQCKWAQITLNMPK